MLLVFWVGVQLHCGDVPVCAYDYSVYVCLVIPVGLSSTMVERSFVHRSPIHLVGKMSDVTECCVICSELVCVYVRT